MITALEPRAAILRDLKEEAGATWPEIAREVRGKLHRRPGSIRGRASGEVAGTTDEWIEIVSALLRILRRQRSEP